MYRKSILVLMGVLAMAAVVAIPAGAGSAKHTSSAQKISRSYLCRAKVNKYDPRTWACTTIIVNPWQVNAGDTTSVAYVFKVRKTLHYALVCFSKVSYGRIRCAYKHKFRVLKRGRVIKRIFQMEAPMVQNSGNYRLDNLTSFYKKMKWEQRGASYWETLHSKVCIITASQPDYQCFW